MSLSFKAEIACDICGSKIIGKPENRATKALNSFHYAKRYAEAHGWVTQDRGYNVQKHFCPYCADGNPQIKPTTVNADQLWFWHRNNWHCPEKQTAELRSKL